MLKSTVFLYIWLVLQFSIPGYARIESRTLEEKFKEPPLDALPRGYWVWSHGNYDFSQIRYELKEFKEKGLGGVDIFEIGVRDPEDIIPPGPAFMSDESVEGIVYAIKEATRIGLKLGLIVSSSWNAGGSWTPPEHASMNLVSWSDTLDGPRIYDTILPFPRLPDFFKKPYGTYSLQVPLDSSGLPTYFKDIAVLAVPFSEEKIIPASSQVINLIANMDGSGKLNWRVPKGRWIITRYVCTNFGQMLWVPSDNSKGLIIDHLSKEAITHHLNYFVDKLKPEIGSFEKTALERFYLASYEIDADQIWTPNLIDEFKTRRGYDPTTYIPVLFGYTLVDKNISQRFLFDFKKTISDVMIDNHYRTAQQVCSQHGLQICSEAGGPGPPLHNCPFEDLKASGSLDVLRGEFWNREAVWTDEDGLDVTQVVKGIGSAAHIYGKKIVEMEAFTSLYIWKEGPFELKPLADRAFCEGMNRVVYHTMSHSPPEAGKPGWSYHFGTLMGVNNSWWPMSEAFHSYLGRCSAMLQEGQFVADACFYYGDKAPNFVKPKHVRPSLGYGYDYDDMNTEIILTKMDVKNNRIMLASGVSYEVLVLPEESSINPDVLKKIVILVQKGATVIGPKPTRSYSLFNYQENDRLVNDLAHKLWGNCDGVKVKEHRYGEGKVVWGRTVREILEEKGIGPDFSYISADPNINIDYFHRKSEKDDIYFVRNTDSSFVSIDGVFRVRGKTPELWNPVSGEIKKCVVYLDTKHGIRVPIKLPPYGSIFVVFRQPLRPDAIIRVDKDNKTIFPLSPDALTTNNVTAIPDGKNGLSLTFEEEGLYDIFFVDGNKKTIEVEQLMEPVIVSGVWEVRFPYGWGAQPFQKFPELISWTASPKEGVKYFSGIATYYKTFEIPANYLSKEKQLFLDLGVIKEVARVYLNGFELGISCFPPHQFDISQVVTSGENRLVIEVANTWNNRLVGDGSRPKNERFTRTNVPKVPVARQKPGAEETLQPSGLLGPVRIVCYPVYKILEHK